MKHSNDVGALDMVALKNISLANKRDRDLNEAFSLENSRTRKNPNYGSIKENFRKIFE